MATVRREPHQPSAWSIDEGQHGDDGIQRVGHVLSAIVGVPASCSQPSEGLEYPISACILGFLESQPSGQRLPVSSRAVVVVSHSWVVSAPLHELRPRWRGGDGCHWRLAIVARIVDMR